MKKDNKIVSLFSGCGGLDLGFHKQGYKLLWANEFIPDFCDTFEKNFHIKPVCEDIQNINVSKIPKADLLIGGPPCQSFSLLGKRKEGDKRGNMVWEYIRVLKKVKPRIFLFENVVGLKSMKNKNGALVIDDLKRAFERAGYAINMHILNSADYGVPQRRRRVFIVGSSKGEKIDAPKATHSEYGEKGLKKWVTAAEALSDLSDPPSVKYKFSPRSDFQKLMRRKSTGIFHHDVPYASNKDKEIIKSVKPGGNYMDVPDNIATKRILNFKKTGGRTTTYGRLHPNKTPYTLNTHFNRPNVGCNIHYKYDRLITIREGLRIQSFPDWFTLVSKNKKNYYAQVGNAVPPLLAEAWAKHLKKYL